MKLNVEKFREKYGRGPDGGPHPEEGGTWNLEVEVQKTVFSFTAPGSSPWGTVLRAAKDYALRVHPGQRVLSVTLLP